MENNLEPMLKIEELVNHMKEKGITFNHISETDAIKYLTDNNNYYNLSIYRSNFKKYSSGKNKGKYIDLDFAYLKDLAIIDLELRVILFKMITDIEHYLKMHILKAAEYYDDGYKVVNEYLKYDYNDIEQGKRIHKSIIKKVGNNYYKEIYKKYGINNTIERLKDIPLWVFLEIITFGELISFCLFFDEKTGFNFAKKYKYIYIEINKLRNAVAHNSNVLCNLVEKDNENPFDRKLSNYLEKCNICTSKIYGNMNNSRIRQIVYTLYIFNKIVTSEGVKKNIKEELDYMSHSRMLKHEEYYVRNKKLKEIYSFFDNIILNEFDL